MEFVALAALVITVIGFWKLSACARKPLQYNSPDPLELDVPVDTAFSTIHRLLAGYSSPSDIHKWTITDEVADKYINADVTYCDTSKNEHVICDLSIAFDFEKITDCCTRIRWSGQYKHWCDADTAAEVQKVTNAWLQRSIQLWTEHNMPAGIVKFAADDENKKSDQRAQVGRDQKFLFEVIAKKVKTPCYFGEWRLFAPDLRYPAFIRAELRDKKDVLRAFVIFEFESGPGATEESNLCWTFLMDPHMTKEEGNRVRSEVNEWFRGYLQILSSVNNG